MNAGEIDPEGERGQTAAVRDVIAGLVLLALGLAVGGSVLDGRADALDYVFDGLALMWIAWGALRLAANERSVSR